MRNNYFSHGTRSEKNLYEDLIIEQLKIYGHEVHYLPRKTVTEDKILGEVPDSQYTENYMIEMYVEDVNGFAGSGDLVGKFGLEIRDELTFVVSRRTFEMLVDQPSNTISINRPIEGDVIYMPLFKKFWQVDFVEDEDPMYQINDLPIFKLKCSVWEYSSELVDTGITEIDEKLEDVSLDLLLNQITLESGTTSAGSLMAEASDGNIEALLTEAGAYLVDEVDGDNIIMEDDPNYVDYIVQEDALTGNLATDSSGASNISFDDEAGLNDTDSSNDIFDFSEKNPFGDPSDI
jgi:hypothetical protein|tara:strand:- start:5847 stop:6719 length:873 start_codon:yes stop_codon:yes gene_type:complete